MSFSSEFIESTLDLGFHDEWESANGAYLDRPHTYLASFPRSGNGWVRLIIAAAVLDLPIASINQLELRYKQMGQGTYYSCLTVGESEYSIEGLFPDIYHFNQIHNQQVDATNSLRLSSRLIKTHHIVDCQSASAMFLIRSPMECLTSAALFFDRARVEAEPTNVNETIGYLAKYYQAMLVHFIEQYDQHLANVLFIDHQRLQTDGKSEFAKALEFLGVRVSEELLAAIMQQFPFNSSFDVNLQQCFDERTVDLIERIESNEYAQALSLCQSSSCSSRVG